VQTMLLVSRTVVGSPETLDPDATGTDARLLHDRSVGLAVVLATDQATVGV
jgi:hypothetical protein